MSDLKVQKTPLFPLLFHALSPHAVQGAAGGQSGLNTSAASHATSAFNANDPYAYYYQYQFQFHFRFSQILS